MPYTPVTLRQPRGPRARRAVRSGAHDADARVGRARAARCSRTSACGSARATSRAPARTCTPPSRASAAPCARRCGIFDASTLGKIEVVGPGRRGVPEPPLRQRLGRASRRAAARYGILLRDDGFVYDDGVVARLAPDRFHVTTTTGGAARVLAMMEDYRQTEWPDLEVWLDLDHRAVGGHRRAGAAARGRCSTPLVAGHRPLARGVAAHGVGRRAHRRRAGAAVPRELHRRARLRDQRAGRLRPQRVGSRLRRRRAARHHALRHRGDARAARREGLHHRRPGHRRHGDAATTPASAGPSAGRSRTSSASARSSAPRCSRRTASSSSAC